MSHLICGGVYDWSTGLLYRGGRYFDPALGIWLALLPLAVVQGGRKRKSRRRGGYLYVSTLVVTLLGVSGLVACCPPVENPAPPQCVEMLPVPDVQLLEHAVKIEPLHDNEGLGRASLGTVIRDGKEILTHNHFAQDLRTGRGMFLTDYTGKGTLIFQSDIEEIWPIDAGTSIIKLKEINLETRLNCRPAQLGARDTNQCDVVQVVYYEDASDSLNVFSTYILDANAFHDLAGEPLIHYADPAQIINPGDSGGGVFKEGALIANNWGFAVNTILDLNGNELEGPTVYAFAALLPDALRR